MGNCVSTTQAQDGTSASPSTVAAKHPQEQRSRSKEAAASAGPPHTPTVNPLRIPAVTPAALLSNNNADSSCVNGSLTPILSHVGSDYAAVTTTGIASLSLTDFPAVPRDDSTAVGEHRSQSPRSAVDSRQRASRNSSSLRSSSSEARASVGSDRSKRKPDKLVIVEFISLSAKNSGSASNGSPRFSRQDNFYSVAIPAAQSAANRRAV